MKHTKDEALHLALEALVIKYSDAMYDALGAGVSADFELDVEAVEQALVRADERNRTWTQEHWTEYERSIAEVEREACALVCETTAPTTTPTWVSYAAAIRARGNT
jgi:hypothetical protein